MRLFYGIGLCLFLLSCSHNFFGGAIISPYVYKFDNKIKCATIKGWDDQPKCYCVLIEKDDRIEGKVFIPMEEKTCK